MTAIQDSRASSVIDAPTVSSSRNVRFSLRKKRTFNDRSKTGASPVNLSSYNSDFLCGLFADVAKANVLKELSIELPSSSPESAAKETSCPSSMFDRRSSSHVVPDSMNSPRPLKKSRVSLRSSSYRSRASCMNLLSAHDQNASATSCTRATSTFSPKGIDGISAPEKDNTATKQDSLAYQLDCLVQDNEELIASVSPTMKAKKVKKDVAALAFPNLPSTVSDSSCESNNVTAIGLTRERCLVQHGSAPEIASASSSSSRESFGWFVDLDDNEVVPIGDSILPSSLEDSHVAKDLAFQARTAPKQSTSNVQEEMEQAYAADTIDSVLGDFF